MCSVCHDARVVVYWIDVFIVQVVQETLETVVVNLLCYIVQIRITANIRIILQHTITTHNVNDDYYLPKTANKVLVVVHTLIHIEVEIQEINPNVMM